MNKFYTILCISIALWSCSSKPEACFTPEESTLAFGESITLTNCSKKSNSININWGDGVFQQEEELTHTYTIPGDFTVHLTVFSAGQKKYDETKVYVTVNEPDPELLKYTWTNYRVDVFSNSSDEYLSELLTENGIIGTDLNKESAQSFDVDFTYTITNDIVTVSNADGESEEVIWTTATGAKLYINGFEYQIVKLNAKEMILRADDPSQFAELDENGEYNLESFDGYLLFYFSR